VNFIVKLFKKQVLKYVVKQLENEELKEDWVSKVNARIDLPGIDETEERKLFYATLDAGFEEIKKKIEEL